MQNNDSKILFFAITVNASKNFKMLFRPSDIVSDNNCDVILNNG